MHKVPLRSFATEDDDGTRVFLFKDPALENVYDLIAQKEKRNPLRLKILSYPFYFVERGNASRKVIYSNGLMGVGAFSEKSFAEKSKDYPEGYVGLGEEEMGLVLSAFSQVDTILNFILSAVIVRANEGKTHSLPLIELIQMIDVEKKLRFLKARKILSLSLYKKCDSLRIFRNQVAHTPVPLGLVFEGLGTDIVHRYCMQVDEILKELDGIYAKYQSALAKALLDVMEKIKAV